MKRCSTLLIIREMQIKLQWDITSQRSEWPSSKNLQTVKAGEGVEKRESSYTVGGNVNWYSHYAEQCGDLFLKNGNRTSIGRSNPTPGHKHQGNQNWKRHVHRSTVYNSQDMEAT